VKDGPAHFEAGPGWGVRINPALLKTATHQKPNARRKTATLTMKRDPKCGWSGLALGLALRMSPLVAAEPVNRAEADWWLTPRGMIQTNLREIDAGMDVASLKAAGANVVPFEY
jgi:hypothetical protein